MNVKFDYTDARVLVTGAGTGIGKGIALAFGQAGAKVALHYSRRWSWQQDIGHMLTRSVSFPPTGWRTTFPIQMQWKTPLTPTS
jgi:hypothetical protein